MFAAARFLGLSWRGSHRSGSVPDRRVTEQAVCRTFASREGEGAWLELGNLFGVRRTSPATMRLCTWLCRSCSQEGRRGRCRLRRSLVDLRRVHHREIVGIPPRPIIRAPSPKGALS
jgi:hypothetical protein